MVPPNEDDKSPWEKVHSYCAARSTKQETAMNNAAAAQELSFGFMLICPMNPGIFVRVKPRMQADRSADRQFDGASCRPSTTTKPSVRSFETFTVMDLPDSILNLPSDPTPLALRWLTSVSFLA